MSLIISMFLFLVSQEMDAWYKSKFQDLTDASTKHAQSVRSVRQEIAGHKKDVSLILFDLPSSKHSNSDPKQK